MAAPDEKSSDSAQGDVRLVATAAVTRELVTESADWEKKESSI
jgi:hypothetical protein